MSAEAMEHMREWARAHNASVLASARVIGFSAKLAEFPWRGTHLDWTKIPGKVVNLSDRSPDIEGSRIARYDHIVAYYAPNQPALVGPRDLIIACIDELYWMSPGFRYLCGAERQASGGYELDFDAFGEYDGGQCITFRI